MFTHEGIKQFHDWTHDSLNALLDHVATLPEESLSKELGGFGFATVRDQLVHLLVCELDWVHRLEGRELDLEGDLPSTVGEFRALKRRAMEATLAYLDSLTPEALNREVTMHFLDGTAFARTPANVIHHILTHAYHHKGQVVAMCRLLDHPAPDTDLLR